MFKNQAFFFRFAALVASILSAASSTWLSINGLSWLPWCAFVSLLMLDLLKDAGAESVRWGQFVSRFAELVKPAGSVRQVSHILFQRR